MPPMPSLSFVPLFVAASISPSSGINLEEVDWSAGDDMGGTAGFANMLVAHSLLAEGDFFGVSNVLLLAVLAIAAVAAPAIVVVAAAAGGCKLMMGGGGIKLASFGGGDIMIPPPRMMLLKSFPGGGGM